MNTSKIISLYVAYNVVLYDELYDELYLWTK